jgi:hypothetical protein
LRQDADRNSVVGPHGRSGICATAIPMRRRRCRRGGRNDTVIDEASTGVGGLLDSRWGRGDGVRSR